MLEDRYIAEFMEKYERLNLEAYNSGGYAYRETKKIFTRAGEEHKNQRNNMKDVSALAESIRVTSTNQNVTKSTTLFSKLKKAAGIGNRDNF